MQIATIMVSKTNVRVKDLSPVTVGLVGASVWVTFDSTWAGYDKVFVWSGCDTVITDTTASGIIPAEVVAHTKSELKFGVYGIKDGKATPTVWANLGFIRPGADPNGDESCDPSLPVWAQLESKITDLENRPVPKDGKDGQDGTPGKDGKDGRDGKDGEPGAPGPQGDPGQPGKDGLDGKNGADGYTPVRGKDYWTEQDRTDVVNDVLAQFTDASEVGM